MPPLKTAAGAAMRLMKVFCAGLLVWALVAPAAVSAGKGRYYKGLPTFVSIEPRTIVRVATAPATKGRQIEIAVVALNRGDRPVSLGYENITITASNGLPAKMLTYEALQKKARNRAAWATFFAVLVAGANSYSAQQSAYGSSYGSAYTTTPYGSSSTTFSGRYYSPVAGQIAANRADAQNADLFASISNRLDATLAQLDGAVLRTTTIDPDQAFGGMVVFELPKGAMQQDMTVSLTFAGEVHTLQLGSAAALEQASARDFAPPPS